jgi:alginate O-acetyltransferase complex protein AlgJ
MSRLFIYLFVAIISVSSLNYLYKFLPDQPAITVTEHLAVPVLEGGNLRPYIDEFTTYYNRTFPGRYQMAKMIQGVKRNVFATNPVNQMIEGKDGWLFLGAGAIYCLQDYLRFEPFSEKQLNIAKQIITENSNFCKQIGAKYIIAVIPEKHDVYPELLPEGLVPSNLISRREQLCSILKEQNVNYVYLKDIMLANKSKGQLFHKTDTHWSPLGATIGFNGIISAMNDTALKTIDINKLTIETTSEMNGDLTKMTFLDELLKPEKVTVYKLDMPNVETCQPERQIKTIGSEEFFICLSNKTKQKKIVLFRDSFSGSIGSNFSNQMGQTVLFWTYRFQKPYLAEQRPDYVIQILAERYIRDAFIDNTSNILHADHGTFE